MMEQPPAPERNEDRIASGGSPAQERARRAEHEDEEREEKERVRREQERPKTPPP